MKAISIKQPWPSLIISGFKDIENRTWACPKKYIGQRVLIHSSMAIDRSRSPLLTEEQFNIIGGKDEYQKHYFSHTGFIIGSVEIVDCVVNHPSIWAEKTEGYPAGMNPAAYKDITGTRVIYNWVLANPILFKKPIPAKGKLSFWEYDGLTEQAIKVVDDVFNKLK